MSEQINDQVEQAGLSDEELEEVAGGADTTIVTTTIIRDPIRLAVE